MISYYKSGEYTKKSRDIDVYTVINLIKNNVSVELQQRNIKLRDNLHNAFYRFECSKSKEDKDYYRKIKEQLHSVTWSGSFDSNKRSKDSLIKNSNYICVDIDYLDNEGNVENNVNEEVVELLKNDDLTMILFQSPSGRGVKIVIKIENIDNNNDMFLFLFNKLKDYYLDKYKLKIDESCKDVSRLCYLPIDENLYYNKDSIVYEFDKEYRSSLNSKVTKTIGKKLSNKVSKNNMSLMEYMYKLCLDNKIEFDYDDWLSLGFIIRDYTFDMGDNFGYELFDRFSAIGKNYDKKMCKLKWSNIISSFDMNRTTKPTIKRLYEMIKNKGVLIDNSFKKEFAKDINYNDNDLPYLVNKIIGYCYIDEVSMIKYTKRNDKLCPIDMFTRNQFLVDVKKSYVGCTKGILDSVFERKDNIVFFNPLKNMLNRLENEDDREFNKLKDYFSFKPDYENDILKIKKWMLGVIGMIMKDGETYDHMLVFLGRQDCGKTYFIRDQFLSVFNKTDHICEGFDYDKYLSSDMQKILSRKAIILDDESTFTKKEAKMVKRILSTKNTSLIDKYEKDITNSLRMSSFIGSTNSKDIFDDETGGKRFNIIDLEDYYLPGALKNGRIMRDNIELDWSKIWGYIYSLYNNGLRWKQIVYSNNSFDYRKRNTLEVILEEYFEVYKSDKRKYRAYNDIREEVVSMSELKKYNISYLIGNKRSLTQAMKNVFGDNLDKYVDCNNINKEGKKYKVIYYNVRLIEEIKPINNYATKNNNNFFLKASEEFDDFYEKSIKN